MPRLLQLESFSTAAPRNAADDAPTFTQDDIEAARLEGYDRGYKTGWDDAVDQNKLDQTRIGEEFARNLRDLGFTFHEARAHVISSMEQLVEALLGALFPAFAAEAISLHVANAVREHASKAGSQPILLRVSPQDSEALHRIMPTASPCPIKIIDEPAMTSGQVQLVMGQSEYWVDLTDIVTGARTALEALHDSNERTLKHG